MHDQVVLHSHHTQRDPSAHGHADSGSVGGVAQPNTTRTMRAGSCSSNATESTVATAGSSNYDTDGSSSANEASRKRKCDVLDHHHHHHHQHQQQHQQQHAASQPRTPGPMLASTSPVAVESRSRSSTSSSSGMHLEPVSGNTTISTEQIRFSCSTTAMTLSRVNSGTQPTHSSPSGRQYRQPLSIAERDSTDRPSSSSSLSMSMPPSPSRVAETSKRPRLAAVASTGHLPFSSTITHGGTSGRFGSGRSAAFLPPLPATLDISSDNDMPNGPPSASFSNLTITQPPSPAYAAFPVNIPTSPCLLPNTAGQFPTQHRDDTSGPSAIAQDSLVTRSLPPRRRSVRSTGPTDLPRAPAVRRIDRHPVRHTPARRRLRRAMSLPIEDEVTLSRRQLQRSRAQLRQEEAPLAFLPNSDLDSSGHLQRESSEMPGADLHADEGKAAIKSVQPQERRLSSSKESAVSILPNDAVDCMQIEQARAVSGSFQHTSAPSSHVNSATPAQVKVPMSLSSSSASASPLVLMSPTQLAALHRFNMPKPVIQSQNRSTFPVFPPRSQLASQSRLSNLSSESTIQPAPAGLPDGSSSQSRNASSSSSHRPNGSSDARRAPPTASIPASDPPIARETLRELDLQEILQCRQLRHDIVFDANLMFRPNFDGDRGDRKREAADRYWTAVTRELQSGCRCTAYPFAPSATARNLGKQSTPLPCICRHAPASGERAPLSCRLPSRIIPLIAELRDILLALLPLASGDPSSSDASSGRRSSKGGSTMSMATAKMIQQTLDPELIAQEVAHGVLDVASLANFFGGTLKSHCAPMRDEVIENMVTSIRKGGQANNMSLVSHGLRMCFEILELMKLDIANHQLRMLRPYLLETAADFECKSFMQLQGTGSAESADGMNVDGPLLDRTKAWLTIARSHLAAATTAGPGQVDGRALVCEGVLELLFHPSMNNNQLQATSSNTSGHRRQASSISEVGTSQSRSRRPKCLSLPLSTQIPETLQLDISRLQLFHGDIVDLCVVHLLLLLFRQLCSSHKRMPTIEELDTIRRQMWVIMSEINTAANPVRGVSGSSRRPLSPIPQSVKKLDSTRWREGMKDVLLQIARYATGSQSGDAATSYVPDTSTLSMLDSWMENNLKTESTLFRIVQKRLRAGLSGLINHELVHVNRPASKGWDLATVDESPEIVNMLNTIIKQNSLTDLAGEVRLLATRIAKVVGYNARAYQELYSTL